MSSLTSWLEARGLGDYCALFEREAIELADLADLTEANLVELGLPMGPRKRLLRALRQAEAPDPMPEGLAHAIRQSKAAIEGERRLVTVLFADVVNSTSLVQHLDPEAVAELLDPVQRLMLDAVHRYGGTINEVRGDGVMAIFGAPAAQEDHALRACQAALDMQTAVAGQMAGPSGAVRLRVGLNSGNAVIRILGNDLQVSYSAMGMMTHLAARMEQTALPGTIRLAEPVMRLVADFVEATSSPPVQVKGVDAPVPAFELRALRPVRSRLEARIGRGLTPFVGRDGELGQLLAAFAAVEAGEGKAIAISAEPGLGKSRIVHELQNRLGQRATWSLGQCVSHRSGEAFHPIGDLLRRHFALDDDVPPAVRRERIAAGLTNAAGEPSAPLSDCLPYLAWLAGGETIEGELATDPQLRRAATFDAVTEFFLHGTSQSPQVVVIEDLHWADQASRELLERLIDALPLARIMLLVTTRPGGDGLPDRSYVLRLVLAGMPPDDTDQLLAAALGVASVDATLGSTVHAKAEGNPFFVEELLRSLIEGGRLRLEGANWRLEPGTDTTDVPDTIQQVLMERIDRLDEPTRRTLQLAAVIGRNFAKSVLADLDEDLNDTMLRQLVEAEFVQLKASQPEPLFQFKHALIQEVAYSSLLQRTRRLLHHRVAAAIEARHGRCLDDQHAALGHHLAAAEEWKPAARHFEAAAERTLEAAALADALALLEQAIDCHVRAKSVGQLLAALLARRATVLQAMSRVADAHMAAAEAADLARASDAPEIEGMARAQMGLASFYLHAFPRARTEAGQAIALGEERQSAELLAAGSCALGWVEAVSGELDQARQTLGRAALNARSAALPSYGIIATAVEAQIDSWQGDYNRSIARLRCETLPLVAASRRGEASAFLPQLLALFSLGLPLAGKGALGEAYAVFSDGLAVAERVGDEIFRMRFLNSLAHVLAECGDIAAARPFNEESRDLALSRHDTEVLANAELNLVDGWLAEGDSVLACEIAEAVLGVVRSPTTSDFMRWRYAQHLFASLGEARLAAGKPAQAAECADQCLDLATRTSSRKYLARGWRLKAGTTLARGDSTAAEEMLRRSLWHARSSRNRGQIWRSELALGSLWHDAANPAAASRRFDAARRCLAGMERQLDHPALQQAFSNSRLFRTAFGEAGAEWL